MDKVLRNELIKKIWDVDNQNFEDFIEEVMFKGFKGYNNMNAKELIALYIQYYGVSSLELIFLSYCEDAHSDDEGYIALAYNEENEVDLMAQEIDGVIRWVSFSEATDTSDTRQLTNALHEFGLSDDFLSKNIS